MNEDNLCICSVLFLFLFVAMSVIGYGRFKGTMLLGIGMLVFILVIINVFFRSLN